jgi:pyruvate dehydrogenase E2 component (dihydrolipoamide acetyltransferase)
MEYEAVDDGVLAKIVVPEGTADVPVNQLIAVLAAEGEDVKSAASAAGKGAAPAPAQAATPAAPAPSASAKPAAAPAQQPPAAPAAPPPAARPAAQAQPAPQANGHGRIFASPLARRLAKEANIDIARIAGSGPHGRVVARDVAQAKAGGGLRAGAAPAAPGIAVPPPSLSDEKIRAFYEPGSYDVVPHDNMRKIIAQRLQQATVTIPHFYLTVTCTIDRLLAAREDINSTAPKGDDGKPAYKLSVNDFVIKALGLALVRKPDTNVTWTESGMLKHHHANIGIAVALPGGLITPVLRNVDEKSLIAISKEMKDFAARARARRLKPEEYQGGASAVSNLGMYGIEEFTAVINPPQTTILAVGTGEQRAVVLDGKVTIATQMKITLSCDHRAIDGALGAELIGEIKRFIESPTAMLV